MSDVAKGTVLIVIGIVIGVVALGDVGGTSEAAEPPEAARGPDLIPVTDSASSAASTSGTTREETRGVRLETEMSGALGRKDLAYAHFSLRATEFDASRVEFHVRPEGNAKVTNVFGPTWERHGRGAVIRFDSIRAGDLAAVIVEFDLDGRSSGSVEARISYRDFSSGAAEEIVVNDSLEIGATSQNAQVLLAVRQAHSEDVLVEAQELMHAQRYTEASDLVAATRGGNVEIGLTFRVARELKGVQGRLANLQERIEEARKPKPRPRPPEPKTIEFVRVSR